MLEFYYCYNAKIYPSIHNFWGLNIEKWSLIYDNDNSSVYKYDLYKRAGVTNTSKNDLLWNL